MMHRGPSASSSAQVHVQGVKWVKLGRSRRGFHGVDEDERDPACLAAVVHPSMVGTLLLQDISGLQVHLGIVEQHVDLARQHDGVINAPSAVHVRMSSRQGIIWVEAHVAKHCRVVDCVYLVANRREIDDAKDRSARRWWYADLTVGPI